VDSRITPQGQISKDADGIKQQQQQQWLLASQ
jgi:hypothetical protein